MTHSSPNAGDLAGPRPSATIRKDQGPAAQGTEGKAPQPKLTVTSAAAEIMRAQLLKRGTPDAAIRFGIRGGGCTGYSYVFEFSDKPPRKSDHVIAADHDVRVYVDPKSMIYLDGTTIHFEKGIRGHGFQFTNPNVKSDCGCGESVSF